MRFGLAVLCAFMCWSGSPNIAMAAPSTADRCDWAECAKPKATSGGWTVDSSSLPRCTPLDKSTCGDECRREFDDRYHVCVEGCLSKRCVVPTPTPPPGSSAEIGAPCVEIESPICNDNCKSEISARQPRCRRDCLQKACPEANGMEITSESLDPGTYRCQRCKKSYEISCTQQCLLGTSGTHSGLAGYGCQKACVMLNCSKRCGSLSPF